MAKRFTDSDKWKRQWWTELDMKAKLTWIYLLDQCDNRGVWFINYRIMSAHLGFKVDEEILLGWFGQKLEKIDSDKFFIQSFVEFQYGALSPTNNAHKSIIELQIKLNSIRGAPGQGLGSPSGGALDKDKDKDKEMDKEEKIDPVLQSVSKTDKSVAIDFEKIYSVYPRKKGKTRGLQLCKSKIKTQQQYSELLEAVQNYRKYCEGKEPEYIKHFSTFMAEWTDWINPENDHSLKKKSWMDEIIEKEKLEQQNANG